MSHSQSALQAIEWLEQQLTDLAGIRNATPRDPSFKNWRQATLTIMQRIWPEDQDRQERFRRIPFSPADPRADARTIREWYSRGCQEATRVLTGFVTEIRAQGVPDVPDDVAQKPSSGEFGVDFPTVDLPSGDLGSAAGVSSEPDDLLQDLVPPSAPSAGHPPAGHLPPLSPGPVLSTPAMPPAAANPSPANVAPRASASPSAPAAPRASTAPDPDPRQPKKGMKAKLRDLLDFAQHQAKALTGQPREQVPATPAPRAVPPAASRPSPPPKLDMIPVGDEFMSTPPSSSTGSAIPAPPALQRDAAAASRPTATPVSTQPVAPPSLPPSQPVASPAPPAPQVESRMEPGMSVVMSRPTTLRGSIEKVTIDSLISPEFRSPNAEETATPTAASAQPPAPPAATPPPRTMPPVAHVPPPTPSASMPAPPTPSASIPAPPVAPTSSASIPAPPVARTPSASMPIPSGPPSQSFESPLASAPAATPAPPAASSNVVPLPARPKLEAPPATPHVEESDTDLEAEQMDLDAFARAADDLMRASPVLGATGRRVTRGYDDPNPASATFGDPDAIAIASLMADLDALGVPAARQPEARARLLDLSRRLESGDLEWAALRKAVWFAMEYPELARRLMPVLLPWIDRAA